MWRWPAWSKSKEPLRVATVLPLCLKFSTRSSIFDGSIHFVEKYSSKFLGERDIKDLIVVIHKMDNQPFFHIGRKLIEISLIFFRENQHFNARAARSNHFFFHSANRQDL